MDSIVLVTNDTEEQLLNFDDIGLEFMLVLDADSQSINDLVLATNFDKLGLDIEYAKAEEEFYKTNDQTAVFKGSQEEKEFKVEYDKKSIFSDCSDPMYDDHKSKYDSELKQWSVARFVCLSEPASAIINKDAILKNKAKIEINADS